MTSGFFLKLNSHFNVAPFFRLWQSELISEMIDLLVAGTGGSSPEYVCIVYISIKCFKVNISSETNSQKILF